MRGTRSAELRVLSEVVLEGPDMPGRSAHGGTAGRSDQTIFFTVAMIFAVSISAFFSRFAA